VLLQHRAGAQSEIVVGKFLAGLFFLTMIAALTVYVPLPDLRERQRCRSGILVGYLGIVLLAAASLAPIRLFASARRRAKVVAVLPRGRDARGAVPGVLRRTQATRPPINTRSCSGSRSSTCASGSFAEPACSELGNVL
jgi:hypothetical protein